MAIPALRPRGRPRRATQTLTPSSPPSPTSSDDLAAELAPGLLLHTKGTTTAPQKSPAAAPTPSASAPAQAAPPAATAVAADIEPPATGSLLAALQVVKTPWHQHFVHSLTGCMCRRLMKSALSELINRACIALFARLHQLMHQIQKHWLEPDGCPLDTKTG